jgi:hypothetical protein
LHALHAQLRAERESPLARAAWRRLSLLLVPGYHRNAKAVCGLTNLPGPALDVFVLRAIKRVLLADHDKSRRPLTPS